MAASLLQFFPGSAEFPVSNAAQFIKVNARDTIAFDAAAAETCYWTFIAPIAIPASLTLLVMYIMASATSGKVDFEVSVESVTPGDSVDLDATTSFDTANTITAPTVPGTAGFLGSFTCTLTNADGIAAGDLVRLRLTRDATDGTNDTAAGDCHILGCDLQG